MANWFRSFGRKGKGERQHEQQFRGPIIPTESDYASIELPRYCFFCF